MNFLDKVKGFISVVVVVIILSFLLYDLFGSVFLFCGISMCIFYLCIFFWPKEKPKLKEKKVKDNEC